MTNRDKFYELLNEELFTLLAETNPLIHHITNYVTVNDCANITLYWGALPVMAHSPQESGEMVEAAGALVLNIGTIDDNVCAGMLEAGRKAEEIGIPIILDPVGVGATDYRTEFAQKLLSELDISVIKGNKGEISILAGGRGEVRGVEAVGEYSALEKRAEALAGREQALVVVTGEQDIAADKEKTYRISGGHKFLAENVGTGCMLASTLGAFLGVVDSGEAEETKSSDSKAYLEAAITAVASFNTAAETAGENARGPAEFKQKFYDAITRLEFPQVRDRSEIKQVGV